MKKRLIRFSMILSVAFNLAVIVGVGYGFFFAAPATGEKSGEVSPYHVMNLSPAQREVILNEQTETLRQIAEMRLQIQTKWVESIDLLAAPQPDWQAINAKQQEIFELHRRIDELILRKWNELKNFVTPEQAQVFLKVLRGEIEAGKVFGQVKVEPQTKTEH